MDDEPRGTRRRGVDLETAILDATLDLLATSGLGSLTMEGVAAAAHTGKASVYRRWPSKEDLLVDAMRHGLPPLDEGPDTGSVREDLLVLLRVMLRDINSRTGCVMQAFMLDSAVDPNLIRLIKSKVSASHGSCSSRPTNTSPQSRPRATSAASGLISMPDTSP